MNAKIWCLVAAIGLATGGWLSQTAWSAKDNDSATADSEPATMLEEQNDFTADNNSAADEESDVMPGESAALSNPVAYLPVQVIPAEIDDLPFDRYIDLALLADAWERRDASLMIDAAIQLSEGERILQRPHRSISSAKLLELAAHIAAEKHDQALLERLHRLADQPGQIAWKSQLTSALKLAGEARAVDPNAAVSVDEMSPQMFAAIHDIKSPSALLSPHREPGSLGGHPARPRQHTGSCQASNGSIWKSCSTKAAQAAHPSRQETRNVDRGPEQAGSSQQRRDSHA